MKRLFVLMGKSATGKDTIYKRLVDNDRCSLKEIVTYTTRPIREGENEGVEYHFVNDESLKMLMKKGCVVEHRAYNTVHGVWNYFTVDDEQFGVEGQDFIVIGTLESYIQIRDYFGADNVVPIYIEVDDGERLARAVTREREQTQPRFAEMCRRFLADSEDFSEEKIENAGITKRFINQDITSCVNEILDMITA